MLDQLSIGRYWSSTTQMYVQPVIASVPGLIWGPVMTNLVGTVSPSVPETERLWTPKSPIPFNCSYLVTDRSLAICPVTIQTPELAAGWSNRGGGLISQFANNTNMTELDKWAANESMPYTFITWGKAMLVLNVTSPYFRQFETINEGYMSSPPSFRGPKSAFVNYNESDDTTSRIQKSGVYTEILTNKGLANISVSLCYAAWDTASLQIDASANVNRSEVGAFR